LGAAQEARIAPRERMPTLVSRRGGMVGMAGGGGGGEGGEWAWSANRASRAPSGGS